VVGVSDLLHVPHASTHFADSVRGGSLLNDVSLTRESLACVDHHTDSVVAGLKEFVDQCGGDGGVRVRVNDLARSVVGPKRCLDPNWLAVRPELDTDRSERARGSSLPQR